MEKKVWTVDSVKVSRDKSQASYLRVKNISAKYTL